MTLQTRTHNICFYGQWEKLFLNYGCLTLTSTRLDQIELMWRPIESLLIECTCCYVVFALCCHKLFSDCILSLQASLLRLRENALVEKIKAELAWLEQQRQRFRNKGADDNYPTKIVKRQRGLKLKLQEQQVICFFDVMKK